MSTLTHQAYAIELRYTHGGHAFVTCSWRPGSKTVRLFNSRQGARAEARHYRGACDRVVVRRVTVKVAIGEEVR